MAAILRALKATYNFFAGDAIILAAVVIAFGLDSFLAHLGSFIANAPAVPNAALIAVFLVVVVGGLVATLGRELAGHR